MEVHLKHYIVEITLANAVTLLTTSKLIEGAQYKITGITNAEWVIVKATSNSELSYIGTAFFYSPDYSNTSNDAFPNHIYDDIWVNETKDPARYLATDIAIWNNLVYQNGTGTNTDVSPNTDNINWTLIPASETSVDDGYYNSDIVPIEFSLLAEAFFSLGIQKRYDTITHNDVSLDLSWAATHGFQNNIELFKWGTGLGGDEDCHGNTGVIDNRNSRRQLKHVNVLEGGTFTITDLNMGDSNFVRGADVIISGDGGALTDSSFEGQVTSVTYSATSGFSTYNRFVSASVITISGTANVDDSTFVGGTHTISGTANVRATNIYGGDTTHGNGTSLNNCIIMVESGKNHDYTGQTQVEMLISTEYSGRHTDYTLSGAGSDELDLDDSGKMTFSGTIEIQATGSINTILNGSYGSRRIKLFPANGTTLTLTKAASAVEFRATDPASIALSGTNKDYAIIVQQHESSNYSLESYFIK